MDPVTILSVAAASFQFAELAVRSFSKIAKITKDFEDVPKRMKDQLNDIEKSIARLRDFSTDLARDASMSSLEPSRFGSLTSAVDNWLTTAADLESTLQGILKPSTTSKRRKWQIAFKSLRQADDIEWQIQRLQSLNHEIWGELLRTLLASQLQIKSDAVDGETKISSNLRVAFQKLQDELSNCKGHLVAAVQEEGTKTRTALDNLTTSMSASFNQLGLQSSRDQDSMVGRVNAHVSEEIRALRALVSSDTRGNYAFQDDSPEILNMLLRLVGSGSLLSSREKSLEIVSRDNAPAAPDPFIPCHQRNWYANQSPPSCRCTMRIKRIWQVSKGLRLRYEVVKHVFPCSQSLEMQQFRSVSIHVELPRFMGPTIEVSVATATTGTGYAFSQTFRCFPTVKRLSSPIFGEFDRLHSFFRNGSGLKELEKIDIDAVRSHIRDLPRRLHSITATGAGSCRDKDEVGNTLLLETVYIMLCLQHRLSEVSVELTELLDFLRSVGLDVSGTGIQLIRSGHNFSQLGIEGYESQMPFISNMEDFWLNSPSTAQSLAFILAQEAPGAFPLYSYFKGFELENYCSINSSSALFKDGSAYGRSCQRQKAALVFRQNQALALELGHLEGVLARRDMEELKSILRKRSFDPREHKYPLILANLELSVFQLAMDWQEGVQELLTRFSPTNEDIEFAIHLDNPLSLKILKILWHKMSGSLDYESIFQILWTTSDRTENLVFELMQESRLKLRQYAMVSLNDDEKERLCLTSHCAADWRTSEAWATLIGQGCSIPLRYKPMPKDSLSCLLGSPFAIRSLFRRLPSQDGGQDGKKKRSASDLLQKYCDTGFLEVTCRRQRFHAAAKMPVLDLLDSFDRCDIYEGSGVFQRFTEICPWFLNNGKLAEDFGDCRPNLLFFLARFLAFGSWRALQDDDVLHYRMDLHRQQELWVTALKRCSADRSDACQCFCSVAGCLPSRQFLRPGGLGANRSGTRTAVLDTRLLLWFSLCRLSEEQETRYVEDAVRLEVFTRLGMTHTCCLPAEEIWRKAVRSHQFELDDIREIQFEESELKGHLEIIMEAYRSFSREFKDWNSGLSKWWVMLDGILPDLSGLSRPWRRHFGSQEELNDALHNTEHDRAALEAQTLQSNGYGGMDFMDVIRLHFSEYLQDRNVVAAE